MSKRFVPYSDKPRRFNDTHVSRRAYSGAKICWIADWNGYSYVPIKGKYVVDTECYFDGINLEVDAFYLVGKKQPYWAKKGSMRRYYSGHRHERHKKYFAKFGINGFVALGHSETLIGKSTGCINLRYPLRGLWSNISETRNIAVRLCHALNTPTTRED